MDVNIKMRKQIKTTLLLLILTVGIFGAGFLSFAALGSSSEYPEYIPVDYTSGLAGKMNLPAFDPNSAPVEYQTESGGLGVSTPPVGTVVYDWYLGAISGDPYMTLRYMS